MLCLDQLITQAAAGVSGGYGGYGGGQWTKTSRGGHNAALSNPSDLLSINRNPIFSADTKNNLNKDGSVNLNIKNRSVYTDFCDTES